METLTDTKPQKEKVTSRIISLTSKRKKEGVEFFFLGIPL